VRWQLQLHGLRAMLLLILLKVCTAACMLRCICHLLLPLLRQHFQKRQR
jgi:hypothetical protein